MNISHLEQGRNEYVELNFSSHSQMLFVLTFAVFWVGRIIQDRAWHSVGVPHDPADNRMIKVIRDRTSRNCLAPGAHVNRQKTREGTNIRVSVGT